MGEGTDCLFGSNAGAGLFGLLLADPDRLEGGQGSQDGASDPYTALPLWRSRDLDLHGGWWQGSDFLLRTVSDSREHRGSFRRHSVGEQVLTDVHVTLLL